MKVIGMRTFGFWFVTSCLVLHSVNSLAAESDSNEELDAEAPASEAPVKARPKRVDVKKLKKQYWSQDPSFDVVQNRTYSKDERVQFNLFGGFINSDPFLDVKALGGSLGYHFSEYMSLHLVAWKHFVSKSSALTTLEKDTGRTANTNYPQWFAGPEVNYSLIYGKLSLLGKSILYYDFHLIGGLGLTRTATGSSLTQWLGVGQQLWIAQNWAFRMDYRLLHYREAIVQQDRLQANFGQPLAPRSNFTNALTVGISYLFGGG